MEIQVATFDMPFESRSYLCGQYATPESIAGTVRSSPTRDGVRQRGAMLRIREVAIFLARPNLLEDPARAAAARAVVSSEELARVAALHFAADRRAALASCALRRRALSQCTGLSPERWRFVADSHGRPTIQQPEAFDLSFSVTNTRGLVACAVARGRRIGIDAEPVRSAVPFEISERYFATCEQAVLRAESPTMQPRRFAELWTLKEAYLKARGVGLPLGVERVSFEFEVGRPLIRLDPTLGDDQGAWDVHSWWPTIGHAAALCVERDVDGPIELQILWDLE